MSGSTRDRNTTTPATTATTSASASEFALGELTRACGGTLQGADARREARGIESDPSRVAEGGLYVALEAQDVAGWERARERGASALVVERGGVPEDPEVPTLVVQDAMRALGHLAHHLHGRPTDHLRTVAVSGSNRRDVADLTRALFEAIGERHALLEARTDRPAPHRVHQRLAGFLSRGATGAIVPLDAADLGRGAYEAVAWNTFVHAGSSRGVDALRTATELEAELDLVRAVPPSGVIVLDADDPACELLREEARARVLTHARRSQGDVVLEPLVLRADRARLAVKTPVGSGEVEVPFGHPTMLAAVGAALTTVLATGAELEDVLAALESVPPRPGRFERMRVPLPYEVWLDDLEGSEHLADALAAIRPHAEGRLWAVVGCAPGLRSDDARRLARALERSADVIVLTAPPGGASPSMTTIQALMGALRAPGNVLLEQDRKTAIRNALARQERGDALFVLASAGGEEERGVVRDWFLQGLEDLG